MDTIEEIKQRIDVVDLVSGYISLKQAGRNFKANCPFHSEKSASFVVSPEKQIWHCFGCAKGGDIFKFVQEYENVDFKEALSILANKAGVELKKINPELKSKKTRQYEINKITSEFYHKSLTENLGKKAISYLEKRKIEKQTISQALLGYAPGGGRLLHYLEQKGYKTQELREAGVINEKEGKYFDYFNNRILFPFINETGNVVGFSGRSLDETQMPKYLNTQDTLVFNKSQALYGINLAKKAIREKGYVIVVEGQLDVLASFQAGIKNVVCSSGTALTIGHIKNLGRYTKNIIFIFDKDEAGFNATKRATEIAIENGMNVKINTVKFGKDPDECIKKDKKLWTQTLKEAKYAVEYFLEHFTGGKKVTEISEKKKIWEFLFPIIKRINSLSEREHWERSVASATGVSSEAITKEIGVVKNEPNNLSNQKQNAKKIGTQEILERKLLSYLFSDENFLKHIILNMESAEINTLELTNLFHKAQFNWTNNKDNSLKKIINSFSQEEKELVSLLTIESNEQELSEKDKLKDVEIIISRLKKAKIEAKITEIKQELTKSTESEKPKILKKLQQEFKKLSNNDILKK